MNTQTKPLIAQLAPGIAAAAPLLLIVGGIYVVAKLLGSDSGEKSEGRAPEGKPLSIPPSSGGNFTENRGIRAGSAGKPNLTPASSPAAPATSHAISIPNAPKIPVTPLPTFTAAKITPKIPLMAQNKSITREDMAKIFDSGTRSLTRKSAVAALKALGFGKTAAYEALATDGRFASWLQFAPDGIITWKS